jgi:cytochrome c nitrite reductase small subunit
MAKDGSNLQMVFRPFRRLLIFLRPPRGWMVPVIVTAGTFCGFGLVILHIANATSYLSDDPRACVNCHIMAPQYATWQRGSHGRVATCNDCHVPHDNFVRHYFFKASDGGRHSYMFTFRLEPQVIQMHEPGVRVVQQNCIRCHQDQMHKTSLPEVTGKMALQGEGKLCWDCHRETPHGTVRGLASAPDARVPLVTPIMPEWMQEFFERNPDPMRASDPPGRERPNPP